MLKKVTKAYRIYFYYVTKNQVLQIFEKNAYAKIIWNKQMVQLNKRNFKKNALHNSPRK